MKTRDNLMTAFAGESQANRRYLAYAKKAETEGKIGLAKLFRVAAEGETIHGLKHLENAGEVGHSEQNLQEAIAGENYEISEMYPKFLKEAEEEGQAVPATWFGYAKGVEETHAKLFFQAKEQGSDIEEKEYYICSQCGYPHEGQAPDICPVCGAQKEMFYRFE